MLSGAVSSFKDDEKVDVSNGSVLEIKLDRPVTERTQNNPFDNFDIGKFSTEKKAGLNDILKTIDKAGRDTRISGILLNLTSLSSGIASLKEIRTALQAFKKSSGKFIYSYSESYSQGAYYLASVADSVYLNPQGDLDFRGIGASLMFFKGTLEKLELEPEIIRHGKFKSAIEPFILDKMSKENREQTSVFIHSIWSDILSDISASRNQTTEVLQTTADELAARTPEMALEHHMVDRLCYYDELLSSIRKKTGQGEKDKVKFIDLNKYVNAFVKDGAFSRQKIAVIYASGDIVSGKGSEDEIGSEKMAEAIRKARLDTTIKAIVLRVNSPGGSALASDVIWRETILAKAAKPFIVSMGDYAASGGYYISCAADTIVAQPNTITGSIGVFGLMFNAEKMLKNKLGITFDTVKTGKLADIGSTTRKMTAQEHDIIQGEVERVYDTFITHVSEGRKISKAQVDSIGQGRVWTGADALRIGLVDVLGGIDVALKIAASKAKLTDYRIIALPEQKEFLEKLMEDLNTEASVYFSKKQFGQSYEYFTGIQSLVKQNGIIARLPFTLTIR